MRYWWVNQNQTYDHEVAGGFLWSPKTRSDGVRNEFYDTMTRVAAGDLVFSFCDTRIKALGSIQGPAKTSEKPNFRTAGGYWANEGWFVPVDFDVIEKPVRPKDFVAELLPYLKGKYDPIRKTGDGNQGVYLAEVSEEFARVIFNKMGRSLDAFISHEVIPPDGEDDKEQQAIEGRTDIGETQKVQLVSARRGQGVFKANVRLNEKACRMTGITDPFLLIASHIKPWSKSSDIEKLDGCNGLLLSPHVDLLFDRGLLTFADDGTVIRSSLVAPEVWAALGLASMQNVGTFNARQCTYLAHHRANFKK